MGGDGGSTVFRGLPTSSLFVDCTGGYQGIVLPHSHFNRPQGIKISCNNGAIIARSLHGGNRTYTSQLSVTVTPELIGDAIECAHDNGSAINVVGMTIINETGMNLVLISYYFCAYHEHPTFSCRTFFLFT